MPMLNVTIPEDALNPQAETALLGRVTDLLPTHEGVDATNPAARHRATAGGPASPVDHHHRARMTARSTARLETPSPSVPKRRPR